MYSLRKNTHNYKREGKEKIDQTFKIKKMIFHIFVKS